MNSPLVSPAADATLLYAPPSRIDFLRRHLWWPLVLAILFSMPLMNGMDLWLADRLYALEGGHWLLKQAWLTTHLIHKGGKDLSIAAGLGVLVFGLLAQRSPQWRAWARPALYLVLAVGLSSAAV